MAIKGVTPAPLSDEGAAALVFDGAPGVADDEAVADFKLADLLGQAIMGRVDLDGELQFVPSGQCCEGERIVRVAPSVLVDSHFRSLARCELEALRLLEGELADIVGDVFDFGNGKPMGHECAPCWCCKGNAWGGG